MSDVIREALDALRELRNGARAEYHADQNDIETNYQIVKAALQGSAGVPEGWKLVPTEPTDDQLTAALHAQGDQINYDAIYAAMLTAAPSPDHSGDANKVVDDLPGMWDQSDLSGGETDADHIADAGKVSFVDGLGAQRMTAEECKEGIEYIIHGDNIYWPLSDDDELRLIQAACGNGEFTYPQATPSVPEDGQALAKIIKDAHMEGQKSATGREGTEFRWAHSDAKVTADIFLAAASQPDHIADAGKVVQDSPIGWIWDTYGQRNFTAGTHHKNVLEADGLTLTPVYTHPAPQPVQSENEAKLVKESYDAGYSEAMLYARVCCGRLDNPENTKDYRDCARFLDLIFKSEIDEAARLRQSDSGDDSGKPPPDSENPVQRYNAQERRFTKCQSDDDGDCDWGHCPQLRDNEPHATGRHCPLDGDDSEEETHG